MVRDGSEIRAAATIAAIAEIKADEEGIAEYERQIKQLEIQKEEIAKVCFF